MRNRQRANGIETVKETCPIIIQTQLKIHNLSENL